MTVELEREGDDVVCRVSDRGVGISEEDQRRLFEPFRRVGRSKVRLPIMARSPLPAPQRAETRSPAPL